MSGGKDLDALWNVTEARHRPGHWTNRFEYYSKQSAYEDDILAGGRGLDGTGDRRAITANGEDDEDEYADMPDLVVASDSSDDDFEDSSDEESESDSAEYDSVYDSDENFEMDKLHKDAMAFIAQQLIEEDHKKTEEELSKLKDKNPFLKLFQRMRGL